MVRLPLGTCWVATPQGTTVTCGAKSSLAICSLYIPLAFDTTCKFFQVFKERGVLNKDLGRKYRDVILAQGGTRDAMDLLVEFLGREPSQEAFLIHAGLKKN